MRAPRPLAPGDPVTVIAPSGPIPKDRFFAGLAVLQARYEVRWSQRLLDRVGYLAGDDDARHAELAAALASDSRAIVCARGGYGAMRLLSRLDLDDIVRADKLLTGFSDITALHALWQRAGVTSLHAATLTQLGEQSADDQAAFFSACEGALPAPWIGLRSVGTRSSARGVLLGGNLEVVKSLVGTRWALPSRDAVLLLEEVGERPYRIDRSLTQLSLSGGLDGLAAIVVGGLTRCAEPDGSGPTAEEVVIERLGRLGIPVLMGLPVGHGERNLPVALGAEVEVDGAAGVLRFLGAATR